MEVRWGTDQDRTGLEDSDGVVAHGLPPPPCQAENVPFAMESNQYHSMGSRLSATAKDLPTTAQPKMGTRFLSSSLVQTCLAGPDMPHQRVSSGALSVLFITVLPRPSTVPGHAQEMLVEGMNE